MGKNRGGTFSTESAESGQSMLANPGSAALAYVEFERDVFAQFLFIKWARSYKDKANLHIKHE